MKIEFCGVEWPNLRTFLADLFAAFLIFAMPIGFIWGYYLYTGKILNLG